VPSLHRAARRPGHRSTPPARPTPVCRGS
jgi:hypothetical protein